MPPAASTDERISPQKLAAFARFGAATVYEAAGRTGSVDPAIKSLARGVRLLGTALTVDCRPRDNLMLHKALQVAQTGDVIVATTGGSPQAGYFGGLMATAAVTRQIAGLAIDGCVRDSTEILDMDFAVFCRGTCMRGTEKRELGSINQPILFGGVAVHPGDLIYGDDDGLVIVSRDAVDAVLAASHSREQIEKEKATAIRAGVSTVELNRLDLVFSSLGWVDQTR